MHILKVNNGHGVVYLGHDESFNLIELVMEFTNAEQIKMCIDNGAFITEHSREFFKFLQDKKGFKRLAIESLTVITMRNQM
jgi:hypothetical protein